MSTRFITGTLLAVLGGFIVVVSQAFEPNPLSWVAFAIGVAIVGICLLAQLDRSRGSAQRALDAAVVVAAAPLIAFSLAASGTAVTWLCFAFALGIVGLAFVGLALHEISNWRASHQLAQLWWLPEEPAATTAIDRAGTRAA